MRRHLVIPDMQVKPDVPLDHIDWIAAYAVEKRPDVIVNLGDFADMPSLSTYDQGKKEMEGRRYIADIDSVLTAMDRLTKPIRAASQRTVDRHLKRWFPEMHFTLGNHENRIDRAISNDAKLDGILGLHSLEYEKFGWEVHPFLKPVCVDGVWYCHYFYNPMTGRAYGGQSMDTRLKSIGFSFTMGHQQGKLAGSRELNNGSVVRGLVVGSCYMHDEDYKGPQGNGHWRGIIMKTEVCNGQYDLMEISLDYLCRKYEGCRLHEFMAKKYPDVYEQSFWLKKMGAAA